MDIKIIEVLKKYLRNRSPQPMGYFLKVIFQCVPWNKYTSDRKKTSVSATRVLPKHDTIKAIPSF